MSLPNDAIIQTDDKIVMINNVQLLKGCSVGKYIMKQKIKEKVILENIR